MDIRQFLESLRGKPLSRKERTKKALELAAQLVLETRKETTYREKKREAWMARMIEDPKGKLFTTAMTDQCFRSQSPKRTADQLHYLIKKFGIPTFLSENDRWKFYIFRFFGNLLPESFIPLIKKSIRKEMSTVLLPDDPTEYFQKCKKENIRVNINHIGEAILGEEEALNRLKLYIEDLNRKEIDYVSIKASSIFSQINMVGWENSLNVLSERLRTLYRTSDKFVNLDMEEYKDLDLTIALFQKVLSEPEFLSRYAGIVLQAYLPNSFQVQKELTQWAQKRVAAGGAPIKIRLVKGANLAMERVESSLRGWELATFEKKVETDANYKRMLEFAAQPEHAQVAHIGVGSHNLFDIAYALILRAEYQTEEVIGFEMLEGMAEPMRRVISKLAGGILLYCPETKEKDFHNAIAYLIRRLDENSGSQNFLRHIFEIRPENETWKDQSKRFTDAIQLIDSLLITPRRTQNRLQPAQKHDLEEAFTNEPDTDFSLAGNREWVRHIFQDWEKKKLPNIPLVIGGKEIEGPLKEGIDPSRPHTPAYHYTLAGIPEVEQAMACAKKSDEWDKLSFEKRSNILGKAARLFREKRGLLIGAMIADGGKNVWEADPEVSEAIDFIEYYRKNWEKFLALPDIRWSAKGAVLVAPPWNFPCSIPTGGIAAALTTGNHVIFKPAPEAVLIGWYLVQIFWEAGVPKQILQFLNCEDEPVGSALIQHPDLSAVILTGAAETALKMLRLRPGIDLHAETGGKNAIIVSAMSDWDQAARELIYSAFGHSGQKCSACSLAILEAEVYDDENFLRQLKNAAESLMVGSAWNPASKITPLIRPPEGALKRGLTQLEEGESWLLKPKPDPENPHLWSPGIKIGVKEDSFTHQTELFGPMLGVMRAENLDEAIRIANGTPYGLTSGLHSLDEREHGVWKKRIHAGNLYINRGITGAIVRRQPFGGHKASSFGPGAKAGGPNYLVHLAKPKEIDLPHDRAPLPSSLLPLISQLKAFKLTEAEREKWKKSAESYAHWAKILKEPTDPSCVLGQDNDFYQVPRDRIYLRVEKDSVLALLQVATACLVCQTPLEISTSNPLPDILGIKIVIEDEESFLKRMPAKHIRIIETPSTKLLERAAQIGAILQAQEVLANGRLELLHYLKEVSLSIDYHRYGNLGARDPAF